jgi:predicted TIM-barrel fold metal-dependent hydrolase
MDEQGIDRAIMWPTLASVLEERLAKEPEATHAIIHGFNQWMYEEWTFNYENRIFSPPVITLPIVDEAIRELDWVVEHGAKIILVRPAPVPSLKGYRSFALPEFDPFWAKVQEYDITVGMHASDDGLTRYFNQWEGHYSEHLPFANTSAFADVQHLQSRGIFDAMCSAVTHGMLSRFPDLRILPVENGSSWVLPLIDSLGHSYAKQPKLYHEDPVKALKRNVWIHPFFEEDPLGLIKAIGTERVVFGSDYPHPEGMSDPVSYVKELEGLSDDEIKKIMGGNLAEALKVA